MLSFDLYDFKLYYCKRYYIVSSIYYKVTINNHRLLLLRYIMFKYHISISGLQKCGIFYQFDPSKKKNVGRNHSC